MGDAIALILVLGMVAALFGYALLPNSNAKGDR